MDNAQYSKNMSESELKRLPKYRVFSDEVRSAITQFSTSQGDSEVVSHLTRLKASLYKNLPTFGSVPHKVWVAKELSMCCSTRYGPSVHSLVVDICHVVFTTVDEAVFYEDLPIYCVALFRLLPKTKKSVMETILDMYSKVFLPRLMDMQSCVPGLLCSLLPGMEDRNSGQYEQMHTMITSIESVLGSPRFLRILFSMLATHTRLRVSILNFMEDRHAYLLENEQDLFFTLFSRNIDIIHVSLLACFSDPSLEVFVAALRFSHKYIIIVQQCFRLYTEAMWISMLKCIFYGLNSGEPPVIDRIKIFMSDFPANDGVDRSDCVRSSAEMMMAHPRSTSNVFVEVKVFLALLQHEILTRESAQFLFPNFMRFLADNSKILYSKSHIKIIGDILNRIGNFGAEKDNLDEHWSRILAEFEAEDAISMLETMLTICETASLPVNAEHVLARLGNLFEKLNTLGSPGSAPRSGNGELIIHFLQFMHRLLKLGSVTQSNVLEDVIKLYTAFFTAELAELELRDMHPGIADELESTSLVFYTLVELIASSPAEGEEGRVSRRDAVLVGDWLDMLYDLFILQKKGVLRDAIVCILCNGLYLLENVEGIAPPGLSSRAKKIGNLISHLAETVSFGCASTAKSSFSASLLKIFRFRRCDFLRALLEDFMQSSSVAKQRQGLGCFDATWKAVKGDAKDDLVYSGALFLFVEISIQLNETHLLLNLGEKEYLMYLLVKYAKENSAMARTDTAQFGYFIQIMQSLLMLCEEGIACGELHASYSLSEKTFPYLSASLAAGKGELFSDIFKIFTDGLVMLSDCDDAADKPFVLAILSAFHGLSQLLTNTVRNSGANREIDRILGVFSGQSFLLGFSQFICEYSDNFSVVSLRLAIGFVLNVLYSCDSALAAADAPNQSAREREASAAGAKEHDRIDFSEICDMVLPALYDGLERTIRKSKAEESTREEWEKAAVWITKLTAIASLVRTRYPSAQIQLIHILNKLVDNFSRTAPLEVSGSVYLVCLRSLKSLVVHLISSYASSSTQSTLSYPFTFSIMAKKESVASQKRDEDMKNLLYLVLSKLVVLHNSIHEINRPDDQHGSAQRVVAEVLDIIATIYASDGTTKLRSLDVIVDLWRTMMEDPGEEELLLRYDPEKKYLRALASAQTGILSVFSKLTVEEGELAKALKLLDKENDEPIIFFLLYLVVFKVYGTVSEEKVGFRAYKQLRMFIIGHYKSLLGGPTTLITNCAMIQTLAVLSEFAEDGKRGKDMADATTRTLEVLFKAILQSLEATDGGSDPIANAAKGRRVLRGMETFLPQLLQKLNLAASERVSMHIYTFILTVLDKMHDRAIVIVRRDAGNEECFSLAFLDFLESFMQHQSLSRVVIAAFSDHFRKLRVSPCGISHKSFKAYLALLSKAFSLDANLLGDVMGSLANLNVATTTQPGQHAHTAVHSAIDQVSLLLLSGTYDQHISSVEKITEFLSRVLQQNRSSKVFSSAFLCVRILAMSVSNNYLAMFWPSVIIETIRAISSPISVECTVSALKLLNLVLVLNIPEFVEYDWIFLKNFCIQPDAIDIISEDEERPHFESLLSKYVSSDEMEKEIATDCQEKLSNPTEMVKIRPIMDSEWTGEEEQPSDKIRDIHILSQTRYATRRELDVAETFQQLYDEFLAQGTHAAPKSE